MSALLSGGLHDAIIRLLISWGMMELTQYQRMSPFWREIMPKWLLSIQFIMWTIFVCLDTYAMFIAYADYKLN